MTNHPDLAVAAAPTPVAAPGRGWAVAGVLAGAAGFVGLVLESGLAMFDREEVYADAALMYAETYDRGLIIAVFLPLMVFAGLAAAVFGAGLRRWLAAQSPAGSLLPELAGWGTLLVTALTLVGSGPVTEVYFQVLHTYNPADPDIAMSLQRLLDTLPWVWTGLLLTTGAVTWAALRHGAAPRWLGWVSAVFTLLMVAVNVFPQQYLTGYLGGIWLVIAGTAFALRRSA
ncbi:hypothetical protein [Actinoplanes aureus]|uniref:DUF4386 family protein n=1 Tax=Actinoplanes aureus TaxID=2792083 RepID=A0A931FX57_9ACTN|nr:hypothetical protein [Actinoplanes aureus]MBG0562110.1 hypothetical protein [Actinoplanes aureus]